MSDIFASAPATIPTAAEAKQATARHLEDYLRRHGLTFCESPPDAHRVFQGELMRTERGLYLFHSFVNKPMRFALEEDGREAHGLQAQMLLQGHLTPTDYAELMLLLDLYPDHVVEFSAFSRYVGVQPGRRMVIWECRSY